jgi:hypothetical protein
MKNKFISSAVALSLAFTAVSPVFAANDFGVMQAAPYYGEYVVFTNSGSTDQSTGILPASNPLSVEKAVYQQDEAGEALLHQRELELPPVELPEKASSLFGSSSDHTAYVVGDTRDFTVATAFSGETDYNYTITTTLAASGTLCNVWIDNEERKYITDQMAQELADEYDSKIGPMLNDNFGEGYDADNDGKVALVCYDIMDGYTPGKSYTAGYFWGGDLVNEDGNQSDMLHIDTYPTMADSGKAEKDEAAYDIRNSFGTVAHEMQHWVNFSYALRNYLDNPQDGIHYTDTWLNESLSEGANWLYDNTYDDRIKSYQSYADIQNGLSLYDWEGGYELGNYGLAYLFSQYLRTQTKDFPNGADIYRLITEKSTRAGYTSQRAVEEAMQEFYPGITMDEIMENFRVAMVAKNESGKYGFMGEAMFDQLSVYSYTGQEVTLKPGGSIVAVLDGTGFVPAGAGEDIKITSIGQKQAPVVMTPIADQYVGSGAFLLTALGGSGDGAFSYVSSNPDVLAIEGDTATPVAAGSVQITAYKNGSGTYLPEKSEPVTVNIVDLPAEIKDVQADSVNHQLSVTIANNSSSTISGATVYACFFGEDGQLTEAKSIPVEAVESGAGATVMLSIPEDPYAQIKVLVWDSSIKPLSQAYIK